MNNCQYFDRNLQKKHPKHDPPTLPKVAELQRKLNKLRYKVILRRQISMLMMMNSMVNVVLDLTVALTGTMVQI